MGCLAPRRVWFYLLYPCSNDPCNSFNCFFLPFKRNQTNCYELYLSSRFYRIYTFNDICILHVVLVKAPPTDPQNLSGLIYLFTVDQICNIVAIWFVISPLILHALRMILILSWHEGFWTHTWPLRVQAADRRTWEMEWSSLLRALLAASLTLVWR